MNSIDDNDERVLLDAAQAGDELALGRLLAPHWHALKLFCGLMLGEADAADRAIAETVLTARSEVEVIDAAGGVRIWIHRIAARVCCEADER
jgi:DNA-directed RNA polymerase specialized sigma24 family protein